MNDLDMTNVLLPYAARVRRVQASRQTDLLAVAKAKHALDPTILDERTPFFWDAEISNDQVDFYFTHMLANSLQNYANEAALGVAFLKGHNLRDMPMGRSLDGRLETVADPQRLRTVAGFYTLPGLNLNGVNTDDFIAGVRSGIVSDVSITFGSWDRLTCDLCGRDYSSWDCPHIAGFRYELEGADGVRRVQVATVSVDNAHLFEVSAVYEGATPHAAIIKAEREAVEGRLLPAGIRLIEQRYKVTLPAAKRAFAGVDIPGKEKSMTIEQRVTDLCVRCGIEAADAEQGLGQIEARLTELTVRVKELEPQAVEGRQYRADSIAAALAEGVRAYGATFDKAGWETDLKQLSLARVQSWRDMWAGIAESRLQGGRQSVDHDERNGQGQTKTVQVVPDRAFAS